MAAETIEIRRYPNRRFYDRSRSRYVTLQEIEELVLQGRDIAVVDSQTGDDLTRQILTQILLENHPDKIDLIPAAMLHSMLRANDLVLDFWREYLRRSLGVLETMQRGPLPLLSPLDWMQSFFPARPADARAPSEQADAVARRLAELEDRIGRLEPSGDAPPASSPRRGGPTRQAEKPAGGETKRRPRGKRK